MKTKHYTRIIKIVKQRERAYQMVKDAAGWGKAEKLKAITNIKQKLDFYRDKPTATQAMVICSLKPQLLTITPGQQSRFQGLRAELLTIIQQCENIKSSLV